MSQSLQAQLCGHAEAHGLNLFGRLCAEEFDSCQPAGRRASDVLPGCGTILLFGSGGAGFWEQMQDRREEPVGGPRPGYHPIHEACMERGEELSAMLRDAGLQCSVTYPECSKAPPTLNFLQMAEMAGLGTISPVVGLLLNPEYGPWVSLRIALLLEGRPFGEAARDDAAPFEPCLKCHKPCLSACPASVYDGNGMADFCACARSRNDGQCQTGCDVRRACPVGADHRYGAEEEVFRHTYSTFAMQKHFGYGWWKFVPKSWRHR